MSKRFIDSKIFNDPWFMDLSKDGKILWFYLITSCDHSGIIELNGRLICFQTNIDSLQESLKEVGSHLVRLRKNIFFIPKYISFQYPNFPKSNVNQQNSALKLLIQNGLWDEQTNQLINCSSTLDQELVNSSPTVEEQLVNCSPTVDQVLPKTYVNVNVNVNDNVNVNKKKKGVQGEKEKTDLPVIHESKTETLNARMIDLHSAWYEKKIGVNYKFSGNIDGPAMSYIKTYITKSIADKRRIEPSDDDVFNGWAFILENYDKWEPFYQKQLKISQINSNIPNILANIKGINGNKTANNLTSDIAEINEIGRRMREQAGSGKGG